MTGVSATTAVASALVGAIGVVVAVVGGRSILAGEMSIGDFVTYLVFIGLVVAPVVSIASVGTQITDALAGLDRIREILETPTEDAGDAEREDFDDVRGAVERAPDPHRPARAIAERRRPGDRDGVARPRGPLKPGPAALACAAARHSLGDAAFRTGTHDDHGSATI
jgi:ABC-type multidrug transport system fused ATPase/permease subunit